MVLVYIDGHEVNVDKGSTILQACAAVGIEIPRFCYHERLSIAGNCRMCLVEVEKSAKPVASCAMPVMENMKVFTNTSLVKKAREGVLEFLLINHPLDCPICDQGGECDLQDQALIFGSDRGRFYEFKRGVDDKNLGHLVKTIMTRCIHCTRCIRFAAEVAGVEDLGTTGRGRDTEVGTYIEKTFDSELSGNIIDLCPVGALTSKPYAFTARSWELKSTESIDVLDAVGSNIRIDVRGSEIMRILPRLNEDINEEWISDKTRFSYDGLKKQRLSRPMVKRNGTFMPISWLEAFRIIKGHISQSNKIAAFSGALVDMESLIVMRDLFYNLNSNAVYSTAVHADIQDLRTSYLLNTTISGLEKSDLCILIGVNPRTEAPLINTRLRKNVIAGKLKVYTIGTAHDLTYSTIHLGNSLSILQEICEGRHHVCQLLRKSKAPMIIVGESIMKNANFLTYIKNIQKFVKIKNSAWNGFNVMHNNAGAVAAYNLGIKSYTNFTYEKHDFVYLVGVDNENTVNNIRCHSDYIVYQGHHGDVGAMVSDLILPGSAYTEKTALFVNMEGRPQNTKLAFYPPGDSREDWKILCALGKFLGVVLPYNTKEELNIRLKELSPNDTNYDHIPSVDHKISIPNILNIYDTKELKLFSQDVDNFYMTDSISRFSQIMAKCSNKYVSNYIK